MDRERLAKLRELVAVKISHLRPGFLVAEFALGTRRREELLGRE
jgi:hypothetical protein